MAQVKALGDTLSPPPAARPQLALELLLTVAAVIVALPVASSCTVASWVMACGAHTVKAMPLEVMVVLMVTSPVVAPAGTVAVAVVALVTAKVVAAVPLKLMPVAPVKLVPVSVMLVPTGPLPGLRLLSVGADGDTRLSRTLNLTLRPRDAVTKSRSPSPSTSPTAMLAALLPTEQEEPPLKRPLPLLRRTRTVPL